ncbi:MAG: Dyp-type peroxidase [Flavisolibacter sp.]|nr:Dyp-type peroxidase [Flavisolibacter sp.]
MSIASQNVLDYPNNNTIFIVWNFKEGMAIKEAFKSLCALVTNLNNSANTRFPNARASVVLGIGFDAWHLLELPTPVPKEFVAFAPIEGAKYTAVSTRGDLHLHIRSDAYSFCIDAASAIADTLKDVASSLDEVHGFRYWDSRSILGFVDGTENPHGADRAYFGIIGDEDPVYKGGSYLFVQKYLHDLQAWKALPVSEQEKVIGRSKSDDIEMPDGVKPSNAHSALANVGDDLKIVRDNMPFGNVSTNEMGTYFIAYASSFITVKKMLTNMFVGVPEGNYDRILDFSTPQTGSLFFVPTFEMLDSFGS